MTINLFYYVLLVKCVTDRMFVNYTILSTSGINNK